jgi:transcriptional regulator with XRE-family HTH domain
MFEAEIEAQIERLTQLLDEAAYRTRRSRRSLERQLGLAHGYLGNLFRGKTELKVYHILLISKLLDLDPVDLLRQALGREAGEAAEPPPGAANVSAAPPSPAPDPEGKEGAEPSPALDLDRLQDLIRQTFRDEVRKLGDNLAKIGVEGGVGGGES